MENFLDVLTNKCLIHLVAVGCWFTWTNNQGGENLIKKSLDRALCNTTWRSKFPKAFVTNFLRVQSDHCLVLVNLYRRTPIKKGLRPFRFEMAWLSHVSFLDFIRSI